MYLFLNFKNTDTDPLYTGSGSSNGTVQVSFVYGNDSGALAPDDDQNDPAIGSAWNIEAAVEPVNNENEWSVADPALTASGATWQLTPANNNTEVIGTGDAANITFSFANIISFTPPGNTQMTVLFSGFKKDDNIDYNDAVFTLNIVKLSAPAVRGILDFYSDQPRIDVFDPVDEITIDLSWTMYYVDKVTLFSTLPELSPTDFSYPNPQPVKKDSTSFTLSVSDITESMAITFTLQAFDANGNYLDSMQFTFLIQFNLFRDAAQKDYPTVLIGSKLWMAANLDYETPGGKSILFPSFEATYGRYYMLDDALKHIPHGWRLPSTDDWNDLRSFYENPDPSLLAGGSSGFNAELGGSIMSGWEGHGHYGRYWTCTPASSPGTFHMFSIDNLGSIKFGWQYPFNLVPVRYVKSKAKTKI